MEYIRIGLEEGATLACGGKAPEDASLPPGYFIEPTIFTDVHRGMRIAREEIFGPVTCVMKYDRVDDLASLANDTEMGLAMSIWSNDVRKALGLAERLEAGVIWINDHHRIDPASPWGGFKDSGIGLENSRY